MIGTLVATALNVAAHLRGGEWVPSVCPSCQRWVRIVAKAMTREPFAHPYRCLRCVRQVESLERFG